MHPKVRPFSEDVDNEQEGGQAYVEQVSGNSSPIEDQLRVEDNYHLSKYMNISHHF